MKNCLLHSVVFILVLALLALAQTPDTLREKYGAPDKEGWYTVREGIGLQPTFDAEGHAAAMVIKPFDPDVLPSGSTRKVPNNPKTMNKDTALKILEELVPSNTRGKEIASFTQHMSCTSISREEHEYVTISIDTRCEEQGGGTYAINIQWRNKHP
jgi:hypothetical protein